MSAKNLLDDFYTMVEFVLFMALGGIILMFAAHFFLLMMSIPFLMLGMFLQELDNARCRLFKRIGEVLVCLFWPLFWLRNAVVGCFQPTLQCLKRFGEGLSNRVSLLFEKVRRCCATVSGLCSMRDSGPTRSPSLSTTDKEEKIERIGPM